MSQLPTMHLVTSWLLVGRFAKYKSLSQGVELAWTGVANKCPEINLETIAAKRLVNGAQGQ